MKDVINNIKVSCTESHKRFLILPSMTHNIEIVSGQEMSGIKFSVAFCVLFAFSYKFSALSYAYTVLKYYTWLNKGNRMHRLL